MGPLESPTLQALLILTAIPAVAYLLFADYQNREMDRALVTRELQKDGRAMIELQKIRLVSLIGLVFQLALFFGSGTVRAQAPIFSTLAFAIAVLVQGIAQGRLESRLRIALGGSAIDGAKTTAFTVGPRETLFLALRGVSALSFGAALYLVCVLGCIKVTAMTLGRGIPIAFFVAGWMGILLGLAVNFALGKVYLRWTLPSQKLGQDLPEWELMRSAFQSAGLRAPSIYLWKDALWSPATVVITGFAWLPFSTGVFVPQKVLAHLTPQELHAVFCHEAAHQKRQHLTRRLGLALGLIFLSTLSVSLLLVLGFLASGGGESATNPASIGGMLAIIAFFITFRSLARQSQIQELDADRVAIHDLAADPDALVSAIQKLERMNGSFEEQLEGAMNGRMSSHPETALRIRAIRLWAKAKEQGERTAAEALKKAA